MSEEIDFNEAIKHCGLKSTKRRLAILGVLARSEQPLSAEDVLFKLKDASIPVNLSTVYRTLDTFAAKHLALKLNIADENRALYEFNHMEHKHYLVCLGCKKTMAIKSCPLENYEKAIADKTDYLISGHKLDIYGYCPDCQIRVK